MDTTISPQELSATIDHTLLKPTAKKSEITQLCAEARSHGFFSVCVLPTWAKYCKSLLVGSEVKVTSVVGFPLGGNTQKNKCDEAAELIGLGCDEIDCVMNLSRFKSNEYNYVESEIAQIVSIAGKNPVKVIIESHLLTEDEIRLACKLVMDSGAQFVKTSTGFSGGGATIENIHVIREVVGQKLRIKASGGIVSFQQAIDFLKSGADRLGCSRSVHIVSTPDAMANIEN